MPSSTNSHCQPASPPAPCSDSSVPEIGPPTTPAISVAVINAAIVRARSRAGNQRVR
jgi:hypothetical protein